MLRKTIIALVISMVVIGFAGLVLAESLLPPKIGNLKLMKSETGAQARKQIARMHGKNIEFIKGAIGVYATTQIKATVWVSEFETEEKAAKAVARMTSGIKNAKKKMFHTLKTDTIAGLPVYSVLGMGELHYYYQKNNLAVWWAVPEKSDKKFVEALVKAIE